MARILILFTLGWLLAGRALAEPAEEPPRDFTARQYIDSTGCVFLRDGGGWQPRLDPDGVAICGYPPTLAGLRDAAQDPLSAPDPALSMPGMAEAEARLLAAVTGEMRDGDFVGSPEVPSKAVADVLGTGETEVGEADPKGAEESDPLRDTFDAALAAGPAVASAAAADLHPDARLCGLLGLGRRGQEQPALGLDPTGGYCAGEVLNTRLPDVQPVIEAAVQTPSEVEATPSAQRTHPRTATKPQRAQAPDRTPSRSAETAMIPPGTRWLEVGRFSDRAQADAAARRLAATGLPVTRADRGGRIVIMAGPFATRQHVVSARDRLVRLGYRSVGAR